MSREQLKLSHEMDQLNRFTLKFKSEKIEVLYQSQSFQRLLKPLYYALMLISLVLNTLRIIVRYNDLKSIPYINIGIIIVSFFSPFIIHKNSGLTSKIMTVENSCILLYQLNFETDTTGQEYYMYGSNFALIQAVFYFATDFYLSLPSVIIHQTFRFAITTIISERFDVVGFSITVVTATFLISVLYICNKAQRLQFLMNLKENTIENQLKTLINKPLAKFRYNEKKLLLDVDLVAFDDQFINYEEDLCYGCNLRSFLRKCKIKGVSIEQLLIKNQIQFEKCLEARIQKKLVKIRLSSFDIDNSIILIIEKIDDQIKSYKQIPLNLYKSIMRQFNEKKESLFNQQFKFGVLSMLFIGQFQIKQINFLKLFNQIISQYVLKRKNFKINHGDQRKYLLSTYPFQLKIFLIQILNIILNLEYEQCYLEDIQIQSFEICLSLRLYLTDSEKFWETYHKNFFIKLTSKYLLFVPVGKQLIFYFSRITPYTNYHLEF